MALGYLSGSLGRCHSVISRIAPYQIERDEHMYIQVNIGRNYTNESGAIMPLTCPEWREFQEEVVTILMHLCKYPPKAPTFHELHLGAGYWDGIAEESAHISLFHPGGFDLEAIKRELAITKRKFHQDNIALIVGSELV